MKNPKNPKNPKNKKNKEKVKRKVFSLNQKIGMALILVIVLLVLYYQFNLNKTPIAEDLPNTELAAKINNEKITLTELNKAYNSLPNQYQLTLTKENLLNQLIQAKVLYIKAQENGVVIDDTEVKNMLEIAKVSNGLSDEDFKKYLIEENMTEEELINQYKKQLIISKFLNETFLSKIKVNDSEISTYYKTNPQLFKVPELVVVRHILFSNENTTNEVTKVEAKKILPKLTKENFCEYVKDYSSDYASVEKCGEYTFSRSDPLVQEFINLSFSQGIGKIGLTDSQFGTHIIWTVNKTKERNLELSEVSDQIKEFLVNNKAKNEFDDYYSKLSKDVKIEKFYFE
jgi:parvulin-like peptidyl-prolyl isomerase